MASIVVRFPDGSKEFRLPERMLEEGDVIWHDGERLRVVSVSADGDERAVVMVEPEAELADTLRSEESAVGLLPLAD